MRQAASSPLDRSGGERIAEAASGWRVAKAFNTVSAKVIEQVPRCRSPVSLPVASDHDLALRDVFVLAEALGLDPLVVGGIDSSRHLESLAVLLRQISTRNRSGGRVTAYIDLGHDSRGALTSSSKQHLHPPSEPVR
jgi:predicted dinucleotide-binding enzyme